MTLPEFVRIYEVSPRDGLQNEKQIVPTSIKIELIEMLANAGLTHIEATAFVSPKAVPQMADSTKVMTSIKRKEGVTYSALVPNARGVEAALKADIQEIAIFASASETFSQKNINCSIEESYARFAPVMEIAKNAGITVRGYVSCVMGCPYEGEISPDIVTTVSQQLYEMGAYEISLGDTIGIGTPDKVQKLITSVKNAVPIDALALHFHDTYDRALDNIKAGLDMGVSTIDASVAGLGGCPYADGASGNVATEDVIHLLHGLRIATNVNIDKVIEAAWFISNHLERKPNSKIANTIKNGVIE